MNQSQFMDGERLVRRYDYEDRTVIAADLGASDGDASIDIVDDTAIVVVGDGENAVQEEFDLPSGRSAKGFIKNGIVTIEVEQ